MTTIKPATPLPWIAEHRPAHNFASAHHWIKTADHNRFVASVVDARNHEQDAAYIVGACNALPRLEAERAELVAALQFAESLLRETAPNPQRQAVCRAHLSALLAKLGEGA